MFHDPQEYLDGFAGKTTKDFLLTKVTLDTILSDMDGAFVPNPSPIKSYYDDKTHVRDLGKLTKPLIKRYAKIVDELYSLLLCEYKVRFHLDYEVGYVKKMLFMALLSMHDETLGYTVNHLKSLVNRDIYDPDKVVDAFDKALTQLKIKH